MLVHADIIVTARAGGLLVGISRAITDFHYCTYLSDLAVDRDYQRRGIGKELIRRTHEAAGMHTTLILLAAPKARTYYPHVGMHGPRLMLDHPAGAERRGLVNRDVERVGIDESSLALVNARRGLS